MYQQLVCWVGYGGERDPVVSGAARQKAQEAKFEKSPRAACPLPIFQQDDAIEKVAERYCGGVWLDARNMLYRTPALFNRLLGWCHVKDEAQEVADAFAAWKAKSGSGGTGLPQTLGAKAE